MSHLSRITCSFRAFVKDDEVLDNEVLFLNRWLTALTKIKFVEKYIRWPRDSAAPAYRITSRGPRHGSFISKRPSGTTRICFPTSAPRPSAGPPPAGPGQFSLVGFHVRVRARVPGTRHPYAAPQPTVGALPPFSRHRRSGPGGLPGIYRGPFSSAHRSVSSIAPPRRRGEARRLRAPGLDLSSPRGASGNSGIPREEVAVRYTSVDAAVAIVRGLGRNAFVTNADIRHAFRLCPVRPADWPLLRYTWEERVYVDLRLPFGARTSPFLFPQFAEALHWIAVHVRGCSRVLHYLLRAPATCKLSRTSAATSEAGPADTLPPSSWASPWAPPFRRCASLRTNLHGFAIACPRGGRGRNAPSGSCCRWSECLPSRARWSVRAAFSSGGLSLYL